MLSCKSITNERLLTNQFEHFSNRNDEWVILVRFQLLQQRKCARKAVAQK